MRNSNRDKLLSAVEDGLITSEALVSYLVGCYLSEDDCGKVMESPDFYEVFNLDKDEET